MVEGRLLTLLLLVAVARAAPRPAAVAVARLHTVHEVRLQAPAGATPPSFNPFLLNVTLVATHSSSGTTVAVAGFYDGGQVWRARFTCSRPGIWHWRTGVAAEHHQPPPGIAAAAAAAGVDKQLAGAFRADGAVECVIPAANDRRPGADHGTLLVDPAHPHHFVWQDGERFFPVSYECDWCYALGMAGVGTNITLPAFLDSLSSGGFNTIVVNFYANHSNWDGAPKQYLAHSLATPWASADQMTLNLAFWQHWDSVIEAMRMRGIVCHMMIMVENKHVSWPAQESAADDLFWSTIIQRYQAYSNVVWDVSKEAHRLPTSYWKTRFALIEAKDSHKRLRTVHTLASKQDFVPLENNDCQFISHQQHGNYHDHILQTRKLYPGKPIVNIEFLYEMGSLKTYGQQSHPEDMRPVLWAIAMAGGCEPSHFFETLQALLLQLSCLALSCGGANWYVSWSHF
jgi:hypothetical protein